MPSSEMPQNEEEDFEEPSEDQPQNSVYDFIYQDVRRIGSFLSQFEEYGVRQTIKATEAAGRVASSKTAASGTFGLPAIAGGSGTFDVTVSDDTKDIAEYTFDPLWTNARRLLDYLTNHNLLNKDIWHTTLGSFIQLQGTLVIIDPNLVKPILKLKSIKEITRNNVKKSLEGSDNEKNKLFDTFSEFIQLVPSSVQAHLGGENFTAWCTLSDASLSIPSSDLALKHGAYVPGLWTMIGILVH